VIDTKLILNFWFLKCTPKMWFKKNYEFDELIKIKFSDIIERALKIDIDDIIISADTYLAYILVLDQFTRNIFRDNSKAFEGDQKALVLSKKAVDNNFIKGSNYYYNSFFLMPLMHSENILDHKLGMPFFKKFTNEDTFKSALRHEQIIEKYGRFPHRNNVLGRSSTKSELEFLKLPGSRF